ncbi:MULTISPECIES: ABC transporter substrate-binding protein [Sulfurimonas]|uniref:ABC transporter substrate-binding protein n=1 Tax=Sulfurimonas TaxID=202746 RepID=UPI0012641143|nr:ABC transporter substrate-binding protein [Sulfurimonas indica]
MKKILLFALISLLFLSSCTQKKKEELRIATNSWIGYAPLFYAKEKGYLDALNIKLITNVSLAEAVDIYSVGKADLVTTTLHEYHMLKNSGHAIVPIILLDRSNGGDMILSNRTIDELVNAKQIYAYLEIDSINAEILEDFLQHYKIDQNKIKYINKDQAQIEDLKPQKDKNILIVTYVPYNLSLEKKGFKEIASTKDMETIVVIDSLCSNQATIDIYQRRLQELKQIIDRSIHEIEANKQLSYEITKGYLGNISYDEYVNSFKLIEWINNPSKKLLKRIKPMDYDEKQLIK